MKNLVKPNIEKKKNQVEMTKRRRKFIREETYINNKNPT